MPHSYNELEEIIGHSFSNRKLLIEALTHPSLHSGQKDKQNYERLEFLGDSVLNLVVSELLYNHFPDEKEGSLAKKRANLVCRAAIVEVATEVDIGKYIKLSAGEEKLGGRNNRANLENTMEAIIGAIYLDGSFSHAKKFIEKKWAKLLDKKDFHKENPKTELQEWAQGKGKAVPVYELIESEGPSHAPIFTVEVRLEGKKPVKGVGKSKKEAENNAALAMLEKIEATRVSKS